VSADLGPLPERWADPALREFAEHIVTLACEWPDAAARGERPDAEAEHALWAAVYAGAEAAGVAERQRAHALGYAAGVAAERERLTSDADEWGGALNEAAWAFTEAHGRHIEERMSGALFNNVKACLRDSFAAYFKALEARPAAEGVAAGVPAGWNLVPASWTREMRHAFIEAAARTITGKETAGWAAALAASPTPPAEPAMDELFKMQEQRDQLRRALEIIAVGDAQNPQTQAAEELIALGWWRDIPEARAIAPPAEPARCDNCGKTIAGHDRLLHCGSPAEPAEPVALLDWLYDSGCDLRSESYGDDDYGYVVVAHHMDKPHERVIGRGRAPAEAIQDAMKEPGDPTRHDFNPTPPAEPTMADAIAAGDGTLHGAIDYWQERALKAEALDDAEPVWVEAAALKFLRAGSARARCSTELRKTPNEGDIPLYAAPPQAAQPAPPHAGLLTAARLVAQATPMQLPAALDALRDHLAGMPDYTQPVPAPQWVSVEDRMPPEGVRVLVYVPTCDLLPIQADEWNQQREDPTGMGGPALEMGLMWDEHEFEEVTHWMPLPPAPGEPAPAKDAP
jgi:hypothetical protein